MSVPCKYCGIHTYKGTQAHKACTKLWRAREQYALDRALGKYVAIELLKALGVRT